MKLSKGDIELLRQALLDWYDTHRRALPWRDVDDPYAIWVSEIMLQQTQVQTVIDYYHRWMTRFPDVQTLARADLQQVLEVWAGLGYYRRARFLHQASQTVVNEYRGQLPGTAKELKKLSGVGDYTAGAIASIAFGEAAPLVDGNVARVLMRLLACPHDPAKGEGKKLVWSVAEQLVDAKRPGDFNQALMELGATLCSPRSPECIKCPIQHWCEGFHEGQPTRYPQMGERARPKPYRGRVAVIRRGESSETEFLVLQRPTEGVLGGLWEFPTLVIQGQRFPTADAFASHLQAQALPVSLKAAHRDTLGQVVHKFSHMTWRLKAEFYGLSLRESQLAPDSDLATNAMWVNEDALCQLPMARVMRKVEEQYRAHCMH